MGQAALSGGNNTLINNGCTSFQGFMFYRPVPIEVFEAQPGFAGDTTTQAAT